MSLFNEVQEQLTKVKNFNQVSTNTGYILELVDEVDLLKDRVNKLEERTERLHNEIVELNKRFHKQEKKECE